MSTVLYPTYAFIHDGSSSYHKNGELHHVLMGSYVNYHPHFTVKKIEAQQFK